MINCNQKMHETILYFLAAIHAVFLVTGRKNLTLQIINCQGENFLSQKGIFFSRTENSCHKKNFLPQEQISCQRKNFCCHWKKFLAIRRNFLSQKETSCHKKKLLVTGRIFMPQLDISFHRTKFLVQGRNLIRLNSKNPNLHLWIYI